MIKAAVTFLFVLSSIQASGRMKVIYPSSVNLTGVDGFAFSALSLALKESGEEYQLDVSNIKMNQKRIRTKILKGSISIVDLGTSREIEEELQAIYFPIDLGTLGWRLFVIRQESQKDFSQVKTLDQLSQYVAGQGIGWADTRILREAGLKVTEASHLDDIFQKMIGRKIDYFPLGANEVHFHLSRHRRKGLVTEKDLMLVYRFARFFFVRKDNKTLASAVERGLKKSFESGRYWELFRNHPENRTLFQDVNIAGRHRIDIPNPNMSEAFKALPKKYFLSQAMFKK